MKKISFIAYILFIILSAYAGFTLQAIEGAESLTLTTYYPAPFGTYKALRLFPGATLGGAECNADTEGLMYYDETGTQVMLCRDTGAGVFAWTPFGGGLWEISPDENQIYPIGWDVPQVVGVGTDSPIVSGYEDRGTLFHVKNGSVLFQGEPGSTVGLAPMEGPGSRLMWMPGKKGAFRAGHLTVTNHDNWDDDTIGETSIALGGGPVASGEYSVAIGHGVFATGDNSIAIGSSQSTRADCQQCLAIGHSITNAIDRSLMIGFGGTPDIFVSSGKVGINRIVAASGNALEVEGQASNTAGGVWLVNSDSAIKTDIHNLDNASETINQLRPVSFRYIKEYAAQHKSIKDHDYYNFIAQDFQKIFPDNVKEGSDGYLQIDTHPVTPYLVAAFQELSSKVEKLAQENKQLKDMISALSLQK